MRAALISMCAVLAAAVAVCITSMLVQFRVLDTMDGLCGDAIEHVLADDAPGAMEHVDKLHDALEGSSWFMEMVASHDQLHEALGSIVDAQVALECEDVDDAYQALARLQGTLEHLRDHETFSLANLC